MTKKHPFYAILVVMLPWLVVAIGAAEVEVTADAEERKIEYEYKDDHKHDNSNHHNPDVKYIKNPLVLIMGAGSYADGHKRIPGVRQDMALLINLFGNKYGYDVEHAFEDYDEYVQAKKAAPKVSPDEPQFFYELDDYRNKIKDLKKRNLKNHDALIFCFSGHGSEESLYFSYGELPRKKLYLDLSRIFKGPKLLFLFACRGVDDITVEGGGAMALENFKNFYVICSSVQGYKSYVADVKGSRAVRGFNIVLEHNIDNFSSLNALKLNMLKKVESMAINDQDKKNIKKYERIEVAINTMGSACYLLP